MTSQNLVATDGTSNFGNVKFKVTNPPKSGIIGNGFDFLLFSESFVADYQSLITARIDNLERPIKSFSQLDLIARRIVYSHTSKDDSLVLFPQFTVKLGF